MDSERRRYLYEKSAQCLVCGPHALRKGVFGDGRWNFGGNWRSFVFVVHYGNAVFDCTFRGERGFNLCCKSLSACAAEKSDRGAFDFGDRGDYLLQPHGGKLVSDTNRGHFGNLKHGGYQHGASAWRRNRAALLDGPQDKFYVFAQSALRRCCDFADYGDSFLVYQ